MPIFTASLLKFAEKGEKTGWTYIEIPSAIAQELNPGVRTSYRVKGSLDHYPIQFVALLPMGDGGFIIPINADMRRAIRKEAGATIRVSLERDLTSIPLSADLLACLEDDPTALQFFNSLPEGHRRYFSNWIEDARTETTRTKRLTQAVRGLSMGLGYGEMIRYFKNLG